MPEHCFLFWGPKSLMQAAKISAYVLVAVISTVLVVFSPFYILATKCYDAIPIEIDKYKKIKEKEKEENKKKKEEKQKQRENETDEK